MDTTRQAYKLFGESIACRIKHSYYTARPQRAPRIYTHSEADLQLTRLLGKVAHKFCRNVEEEDGGNEGQRQHHNNKRISKWTQRGQYATSDQARG
jgi:hypothetical protein